jgi:RND superfamily putative drug exporter
MLKRLARWSYTHRWRMLVLWVVAFVGFNFLSATAGGAYSANFSLPGAESQKAFDLLKDRFPGRSGDTTQVVFRADHGVADPAVQRTMTDLLTRIATLPHVDAVVSPYDPAGAQQVSRDGKIAFADVQFNVRADAVPKPVVDRLISMAQAAAGPGLQVELGGQVIEQVEFKPPGTAEIVGLSAAIIILLITFGSLLAMLLPVLTAVFGIGIGLAIVLLSANWISVPNFTPQLAAMIGFGVGVDYALFIVTRYRQALRDGQTPEEAVVLAMATSGRAVVFAGIIVVISFLGILLMGFSFVQGIAIGGASAVLVTMLASITLLPATLGFVGRNIDRLSVHWRAGDGSRPSFWYRWSRMIQRRPWPAVAVALLIIGVLTIPLFSLRLGSADAGNDPTSQTTRRAYDLISQGFGPGFNGPLVLAAELPSSGSVAALQRLDQRLASEPGVAFVSPPVVNQQGDAAVITLFPTTSPQDSATSDLVHRLRDQVVPQTMQGTGVNVFVGGITATFIDFAVKIGQRLPILIGVVIALSFLLLLAVFRSLVVPVKAALMNLLSIGASFGVVVAVFQWGYLKNVFGVGATGPIEAWAPMMLFTILFGLSMDYEVFLLSRIREEYMVSRNNSEAVANGLTHTARVISAAAAIMIAVFLSFVFGFDIRQIKLFGLGLAVAVLIDATVIRMLLVPAVMELLGDVNWYMPRWLGRVVPKVSVETGPDVAIEGEREPVAAGS